VDFGSGRNRWGDYSATTLDPTDPQIFWTTQEYVNSTNSYQTRATEIIIPLTGEARWANNVSSTFVTGANWIGGSAPTGTSHVVISRPSAPGSYTITLPAGTTTNDRMSVRQGNVQLSIPGGATWALSNVSGATPSVTIGEFTCNPTVTVSGGGILQSVNTAISLKANGSINLSTATVTLSSSTWLNSGSMAIGGTGTTKGGVATFTVSGTGALSVGTNLKLWNNAAFKYNGASLSVGGNLDVTGANFTETANGTRLAKVGNLLISGGGTVDLNDNDLQATASSYGTITSLIATARNFGSWNQSGLTSSAAKNDPNQITTLGTMKGSEWRTLYGAANSNLTGWFNGDFDYSGGAPDGDDYALIDGASNFLHPPFLGAILGWVSNGMAGDTSNWDWRAQEVVQHYDQFGQGYITTFMAHVPEPASIGIVGIGLLGSLARRRRSN
jgi:hypothetical protein